MSTALASRNRTELQELALAGAARLEGKAADEIVEWALGEFGERFCVTSSFADAVLVHVVSKVAPGIEVVFLDTGLHFAETLRVREIVQRTLPVTVRFFLAQRPDLLCRDRRYSCFCGVGNPCHRYPFRREFSLQASNVAVAGCVPGESAGAVDVVRGP